MRGFFIVVWIMAILFTIMGIRGCVKANYEFENKYAYAWNLSDKSSTIEAKCNYINEFVGLLSSNKEDFASYNAIWLKTKDNNLDYNIKAVSTLRDRLNEIKGMDPTSFQYNTAIQQITAQEQGEAHALIGMIQGCYVLQNYPLVWDWFGLILICVIVTLYIIGFCGLAWIFEEL